MLQERATPKERAKVLKKGAVGKKKPISPNRKYPYVPRDPIATRQRLLDAAVKEFASKGYGGARVDNIAKSANANMRMLYHYFVDKERLYIAALEASYQSIRLAEQNLHIESDEDPKRALQRLIVGTFDHFAKHPDLVSIVMNENILHARYFKQTKLIPKLTRQLFQSVRQVLKKGVEQGVFVRDADPVQVWLSIFSLCWVHVSNKHTMSWTLQMDLTDPQWLEKRKRHVIDVIMSYICKDQG